VFYGLIRVFSATSVAMALFASPTAHAQEAGAPDIGILHQGQRVPAPGAAAFFTGKVRVEPLFPTHPSSRTTGGRVTFEAGARTAWHTHPAGQTLMVTEGRGLIQRWDGPLKELLPGDVVWIPAGVKHWHGAAPDSAMTHLSIQEQVDGRAVDWLEQVSDAQYGVPVPGGLSQRKSTSSSQPLKEASAMTPEPTPAERAIGSISPKLVQLTDQVLFGDVWERPGLSKRDRSLITMTALIAMNRPDQLRWHMAKGLENGLTRDEVIETITHLAFYAGWPSAMTAIQVAKDVFSQ